GVTKYVWSKDLVFYVPNIGYRLILCDFGMSSISPTIQNLDVYSRELSNLGVSSHRNQSIDLCKILHQIWFGGEFSEMPRDDPVRPLLKEFLSNVMRLDLFPDKDDFTKYWTPIVDTETMSTEEMLNHVLFKGLR